MNCQLDANLGTGDPAKDVHLAGICGQGGTVVNATATANGQSVPVALTISGTGPGINLNGKMPDGSNFVAHIDLVSTNG